MELMNRETIVKHTIPNLYMQTSEPEVLEWAENDPENPEPNGGDRNPIRLAYDPFPMNDRYFPQQWPINNTGQDIGFGEGKEGVDTKLKYAWEFLSEYGERNHHQPVVAVLAPGFSNDHSSEINWLDPANLNYNEDRAGTAISGIIGAFGNNQEGITGIGGENWPIKIMRVQYDLDPSGLANLSSLLIAYDQVFRQRSEFNATQGRSGEYVVALVSTGFNNIQNNQQPLQQMIIPMLETGIFHVSFPPNGPSPLNFSIPDHFPSVSSGIYFYKLQTDTQQLTKKMILMK
jgi:hypothetical protein